MTVRWINVYPNSSHGTPRLTRDDADYFASGGRVYCIKVTLK